MVVPKTNYKMDEESCNTNDSSVIIHAKKQKLFTNGQISSAKKQEKDAASADEHDTSENGFPCNGVNEDENSSNENVGKVGDDLDKSKEGNTATPSKVANGDSVVDEKRTNGESIHEHAETKADESKILDRETPVQDCGDIEQLGMTSKKSSENEKMDTEKESVDAAKTKKSVGNEIESRCEKKETCSSEKENKGGRLEKKKNEDVDIKKHNGNIKETSKTEHIDDKSDINSIDSGNDDIEIIGESKVDGTSSLLQSSQGVVLLPNASSSVGTLPYMSKGFVSGAGSSSMMSSSAQNHIAQPLNNQQGSFNMRQGYSTHGNMSSVHLGYGGMPMQGQGHGGVSLLAPTVAPPKPQSSLDQIELIRWEIQNRINTRPKYFKPNPASDLGPLAKFLFDIGSDLIKESVYHDLVNIQSKKNDDDKLTAKEKDDLEKLKEIERDLFATIGHLKLKMRKKCKTCKFCTESSNVLYLHKQFPHEENKSLHCAHCNFVSKQAVSFKFHMESEHNVQPRLYDKKAFFECDLCPYENNQEQKLNIHKTRCIKQFRPLFNLHPSCLSGAEINLCLENIFYKPLIPKNLKLLQQKHAQQQAALAEARRQQLQVQALAAQKNAAAVAAKKAALQQQQQQQQLQYRQRQSQAMTPRFNHMSNAGNNRMPLPPHQPVRYNSRGGRAQKPTVANMLKNKSNNIPQPHGQVPSPQATTAGGFEVCEICGGYVKDRKALRIHFFYAHRIDLPFNLFDRAQAPLYCATCYMRFWTAQGLRKHIEVHREESQASGGVAGKCISCGVQVANLIVHMRVVHSREIQHYMNALMCIFCGNHYTSRVDLERHIRSAHGNVDFNTGILKGASSAQHQPSPKSSASQKKSSGSNNSLVKGSVCVLCNLNFGRNVDLTRHCMRMHHTCMKCGMVVIDKPSLMKHTCLTSPSGTRNCTMCRETGFHPAYFVKHLRDKHLRKFSIKVARVSESTIERWTKRPCPFKREEILVEISDSDEDVPLAKVKAPTCTPKKRPRIGPASKIKRKENCDQPVSDIVSKEKENNLVEIKDKDNETKENKKEEETVPSETNPGSAEEEAETEPSGADKKSPKANKRKNSIDGQDSPTCDKSSKKKRSM